MDASSEGLILVTNDGELADRLTHPRYGVAKTYHVTTVGHVPPAVLAQLRQGVHLAEGLARVVAVRIRKRHKKATVLEIVLDEGRNREIRRLLARVGHKVLRLVRVSIGPLKLANLPRGASRRLTADEVRGLYHATRRRSAPTKPQGRHNRALRR